MDAHEFSKYISRTAMSELREVTSHDENNYYRFYDWDAYRNEMDAAEDASEDSSSEQGFEKSSRKTLKNASKRKKERGNKCAPAKSKARASSCKCCC